MYFPIHLINNINFSRNNMYLKGSHPPGTLGDHQTAISYKNIYYTDVTNYAGTKIYLKKVLRFE